MRRVLLVLFLLWSGGAESSESVCGLNYAPVAFAHEAITVSTSAIGLTVATFAPAGSPGAVMAVLSTETDSMRFLTDGTAPTSSVGILVISSASTNAYITLCQPDLRKFKAIRSSANDVTLNVVYYTVPN